MASTRTKAPPVPLHLALREAHDWCESAKFQGERLTELLDHQVAFDHANAMAAEWRALKAANVLPGGARVEVVESYFFLASVQRLLEWLGHLTRNGNRPPKEVAAAIKAFKVAAPTPAALKALLDKGFTIGGWDLPELSMQSPEGGFALKAARGRDYVMAGGVNLPQTLAALRALGTVLAPARPAATPAA
jgi:hypothetical protein